MTNLSTTKTRLFSLEEESMYDLNTYMGRVKHFAKITDIRQITITSRKLEEYQNMIKDFKENREKYNLNDSSVNEKLWKAQYGIRSAVNSETGKVLPIYARMCAFVLMNMPIAWCMSCLPVTRFNILFVNFANQSYNAMLNYNNSSGTEDSLRFIVSSYALAVFSSVGMGLFLRSILSRGNRKVGNIRELIIRFLPSCTAGFINIFFSRSDYITKGIAVRDEKGNSLGLSKISGIKAILEGGISRFVLPLPLFANYFIMKRIDKMKIHNKAKIYIELILCGIALCFGLPFSIGVFKQIAEIDVNILEQEIQNEAKKKNITKAYYNKGL